ncbi:MAG: YfiR family protein [bacterium]|nr:YfiR family protein [bacterium]
MTALFLILWPQMLVTSGGVRSPQADTSELSELHYKVAFLERFTRFVEWPKDSDVNDVSKPFILGLIGEKKLLKVLREVYFKQNIKNKKVEIRMISQEKQIDGCNLLFIEKPIKWNLFTVVSAIKDKPILTITDEKGTIEKGFHIRVYFRRQKLVFDANQGAFQDSLLGVDYRLFSGARNVVNKIKRGKR